MARTKFPLALVALVFSQLPAMAQSALAQAQDSTATSLGPGTAATPGNTTRHLPKPPSLLLDISTMPLQKLPAQHSLQPQYLLSSYLPQQDNFQLRNHDKTLGRKLLRGSLLIGGVELGGMVVLTLLPKEITKWEDDYIDDAKDNLISAWTRPPVWDKDDWVINYIGHPYAGSIYYNAIRSQDATIFESFMFSTVQSAIWEYVIEGIAEQPSIQDLIVTPVAGAIIGEFTHKATLNMRKNGFGFWEKVFVLVLNPTYWANNGFH